MSTPEPQGAPAPQEQGGTAPEGSDEGVAQGYFDEWSQRVDDDIDHLKQSIAQLMQVKGSGNAGPTTAEQGGTSGAGSPQGQSQQAGNAPAPSGGGVQGAGAPAGEPSEHAPAPSHWYFKRLFGG